MGGGLSLWMIATGAASTNRQVVGHGAHVCMVWSCGSGTVLEGKGELYEYEYRVLILLIWPEIKHISGERPRNTGV